MNLKRMYSFNKYKLNYLTFSHIIPSLILLIYMYSNNESYYLISALFISLSAFSLFLIYKFKQKNDYEFKTISSLLDALKKNDFTLRGKVEKQNSAYNSVIKSINTISEELALKNIQEKENELLLSKVINQIDMGILALNQDKRITLMNPTFSNLLKKKSDEIKYKSVYELGLIDLLSIPKHEMAEIALGPENRTFYIFSDSFIEQGEEHYLYFITDIRRILHDAERKTWQNLLRVLSHEINNSLTPIASVSDTLKRILKKSNIQDSVTEDLNDGLSTINERANSLTQFIQSYKQLARLPEPQKSKIKINELLKDVLPLFNHREVVLEMVEDLELNIDSSQMQQVFVNLIKNADEAMLDSNASIRISCTQKEETIRIQIEDEGVGLKNSENLFIPFYSTKENGSGIGLVLCKQIILNHSGDLTLENKPNGKGAQACITLPIS